ncbi:hypothetical protein U9M48_026579 [Paspalum notatum var. saurae]|uniref:Uncharacterized protein n=1 Tax=Paspalum notatum var. saurae TaxID=547442 RepID=A0AAQ3WYE1_PASNO
MASAVATAAASNLPAAVAVPYGWLSPPRASFGGDAAGAADLEQHAMAVATPEPAISKDFIDFEFSLGGSATMLPADELFADGKLLPLRKAPPLPDPEAPAAAAAEAATPPDPAEAMPAPASGPIKPLRRAAAAAADGADPYVFSPKAPSCSSRWRELLGLKRAAAAQSPRPKISASSAAAAPARATNSSAAARSLKLLLQRNAAGRASASDLASAPLLLRDSSDSEASLSLASSRFSLSSSSSSSGGHDHDDVPRLSLDSAAAADPNPPRIRLVRRSSHSSQQHRHVHGLERSSSSPCSFHAAAKSRSSRAVDRSYSSGVRVAPVVLNVPVCSRPVFGFFKDKKDAGGGGAARSSAVGRSRAQGWSGELAARPPPSG